MPAPHRTERVSDEIRRRLTELIQTELKDPRVSFMSTITRVQMSSDLRYAKVFVSVMGTPDEQKSSIAALRHAAGFLRHELGADLRLRHIPELQFVLDHSIEEGDRVLRVIREVETMTTRTSASDHADERVDEDVDEDGSAHERNS